MADMAEMQHVEYAVALHDLAAFSPGLGGELAQLLERADFVGILRHVQKSQPAFRPRYLNQPAVAFSIEAGVQIGASRQ